MNALVRDLTLDEITAVSGGITEIVVTAERTSSGGSSPAASGDSRDSEVANRQRQLQSQNRKAPVPEDCTYCHTPPNDGIHKASEFVKLKNIDLVVAEVDTNAILQAAMSDGRGSGFVSGSSGGAKGNGGGGGAW